MDPVNPKDETTFAQSNLVAAVLATDDMVVMGEVWKVKCRHRAGPMRVRRVCTTGGEGQVREGPVIFQVISAFST